MTSGTLLKLIFEYVQKVEYRTPQTYGAFNDATAADYEKLAATFQGFAAEALIISNALARKAKNNARAE